jgi:hypothetical protein
MSLQAAPSSPPPPVDVAGVSERANTSSSETSNSASGCVRSSEALAADEALGQAVLAMLALPFDKLEQQLHELK